METTATVMIVDDEPIIRLDLREMMHEAGYRVIGEAKSGEEALRYGYEQRPDLILMDIRMPGMDGIQAAAQIRKWYDPAIILLTSYNRKEWAHRAKESGAYGYVVKPFTESSLYPSVEIALEQRRRLRELQQDVQQLKQKMTERKLIDKAKAIIMQRMGLDEEAAYGYIRSRSMHERISLVRVAERITVDPQSIVRN